MKNQFLGPIPGGKKGTPLGYCPFFHTFFSLVCFCLFLVFYFFIFLHFLFISSYFGFSMFFIFFFHFSEEKVSSFLFSCISFKYFSLLALVSEFNCFLRSRCSMEMWCPDDIGRDSWDWVGPPAWERACFNSPEWGGGSSPVKTEPPQIVLLLLLFWTRTEASRNVYVNTALKFIVQEPSMAKNSSPSRAPKNGAQLRENPEEREKRPKKPKNPSNRLAAINTAIQLVGIMSRFPVRTARDFR